MTDDYPLVTIAIPTYNRANAYLKQAIKSAVGQTYTNLEVIVADNCSIDHTETVVKKFKDQRIRYIKHKRNIGANNNFNYCVKQANGIYFLLLHDDDLIDEDFVAVCMRAVNYEKDVGLIRTGTRKIDAEGKVILERKNFAEGLSVSDFFLSWFLDKTPMYLCSTLFNTEDLKSIGGFKSKHNLFQDVLAEVVLASKFGRIDIQDIKASFRNHPLQNTHAAEINAWCDDSLILLKTICSLAPEKKEIIRAEGLKFFANRNYKLAKKIKSPYQRYLAYCNIFRRFGFQFDFFKKKIAKRLL
jgi:glycosyltransferase involved in cell wall biosynthesis